jgi:hypothetical protein
LVLHLEVDFENCDAGDQVLAWLLLEKQRNWLRLRNFYFSVGWLECQSRKIHQKAELANGEPGGGTPVMS